MESVKSSPSSARKALKAAFPHTLPILAGFTFLGIAYGILMHSKGFSWPWTLLMSATIFAGSMEFVTVGLLAGSFHPAYAYCLTLMVNARHLFYGISMLDKYRDAGWKKFYLIFGMCDESFSINCSAEPPADVDRGWFQLFVTLLNHFYWVMGAVVGSLAGAFVPFDTTGIEFSMTALFVVILLNQWLDSRDRRPALAGLGASLLCLALFGPENFILPAMALILTVLTVFWRKLEPPEEGGGSA